MEVESLTNFTLATADQSGYTRLGNLTLNAMESLSVIRTLKRFSISCLLVLPVGLWATVASADPDAAPASKSHAAETSAANGGALHVELNKLEPFNKGCRAYIVVNNPAETAYTSYKIDLVLFQTDGVIGKRFSIDLAPLKAKKKSVKLFDIDGIQCDKIGSFLINDVMECKAESGAVSGCLDNLKTSTLTNVQLSK